MPKKFMTVHEVARLLGVTPLTIRNWDAKGKLIAYRNPVNNYRIYKVDDVEVLLKQIEQSMGQRTTPSFYPKPPVKPAARRLSIETD